MQPSKRIPSLPAVILAILLAAGSTWTLGGSSQTGTLHGKAVDAKGAPFPGVVITLRSDALVRERALVTDTDGNFFTAGLPPGTYSVTAQLTGYLTLIADTQIEIDKTTVLTPFTMQEGELKETVKVSGERPVIDKTTTERGEIVDKSFSENLPVGRFYLDLLSFAPGVTDRDGDGNANVLGGTDASNTYLIDGVDTRDPVTGTWGLLLNYDSVEAIDIKLAGISAEYGETQGGVSNIILKSGGNEFTGSIRDSVDAPSWTKLYNLSSQKEFAKGTAPPIPGRGPVDDNKTHRILSTLGGPIVSDSAWFFLAYDRIETSNAAALGNPTGGPFSTGTYGAFFDGDPVVAKGTWQATNNHRFQYQYSEDPARVTVCYGMEFFGGPCYEDYNVDLQKQGGFNWIGTWNAVWGSNFTTELKYGRYKSSFFVNPLTPIPARPGLPVSGSGDVAPAIDLDFGALFDANIFASEPEDRSRKLYEGAASMFFDTKNWGSHTVKIGADYHETTRVGASDIQGNALFFFAFGTPPPGLGGSGDPYDINNRSYLVWYDFAPPSKAGPVNKYTALYVQDDWQLNKNFGFNLGIRFEKSDNENDVGEKIINDTGVAPRLGAVWDVTGEGKRLVKATAARYLAGINLTTLSPFVRRAGGQSSYDTYINTDFGLTGPPNFVLVSQTRPDPNSATFASGIKPQAIDEFTLSYEHLFTPTLGATAQLVDRKWKDITTVAFTYKYDPITGIATKIQKIDNNPDAKRDYKGLILTAEKRLADNWTLRGNYTYSKTKGNVVSEGGFDSFESYPGVPQVTENRFGPLPWDAKHLAKIQAFYNVPLHRERHGLTVGATYDYGSGNPYAKFNTVPVDVGPGANGVQDEPLGGPVTTSDDQPDTVTQFFEKRGSHRAPSIQSLDLSLIYTFALSKKVDWQTRLEVFNVTNEQNPFTINARFTPGGSNDSFGHPTSYSQFQAPRYYRVHFALTW